MHKRNRKKYPTGNQKSPCSFREACVQVLKPRTHTRSQKQKENNYSKIFLEHIHIKLSSLLFMMKGH